jgi:hypothetical protein
LKLWSCGLLEVDKKFNEIYKIPVVIPDSHALSAVDPKESKEKKELGVSLTTVWDHADKPLGQVFFLPVWTRISPFSEGKRYGGGLLLVPTTKRESANSYERVGYAVINPKYQVNLSNLMDRRVTVLMSEEEKKYIQVHQHDKWGRESTKQLITIY